MSYRLGVPGLRFGGTRHFDTGDQGVARVFSPGYGRALVRAEQQMAAAAARPLAGAVVH